MIMFLIFFEFMKLLLQLNVPNSCKGSDFNQDCQRYLKGSPLKRRVACLIHSSENWFSLFKWLPDLCRRDNEENCQIWELF